MKFFLFILALFILPNTFAQTKNAKAASQTTKIGFIQQNYSGTTNKSFALGSPGYGVELSTDSGGVYFRYFLKGRFLYSEGRQNFLDGSTPFSSAYKYSMFAPELGISLYPVKRREKGMNLYLWGVGSVSYNYLDLATVPTNSAVKSKDQGYGLGYGGGLGFELIFSFSRSGSRYLTYGEIGFRDEKAQLVQSDRFEVSGMTLSLGVGF